MAASVVIDASAVISVVTNEPHKPVLIRLTEGSELIRSQASPLDIEGVDLGLSAEEIVSALREARAR